ncbi:MAG: hypothetical protein AB8G11_13325 [Saprospiraceae bacterium]
MGESNTIYYIVGFIVIAHFVIGFGILVYKINNAPSSKKDKEIDEN